MELNGITDGFSRTEIAAMAKMLKKYISEKTLSSVLHDDVIANYDEQIKKTLNDYEKEELRQKQRDREKELFERVCKENRNMCELANAITNDYLRKEGLDGLPIRADYFAI